MIRIFNHMSHAGAEVYYRAMLPAKFCRAELEVDGIDLVSGNALDSDEDLYDAYLVHRNLDPFWQCYLRAVRAAGRPIAWELDDNHWQIPEWNEFGEVLEKQERGVNQLREWASTIICSTQFLAGVVGRPEATFICPNLIDPAMFPRPPAERVPGPLRILWAGSNTHKGDVALVVPAVKRLAAEYGERVCFLFWSLLPEDLRGLPNVVHVPRAPLERYHTALAMLRPDVALAPLVDHPFNRARTNLKWLEMGAAGAAFLGSHLDPYHCVRHGEDGMLVPDDGWEDAIRHAIEDPELRRYLAGNARRRILREWSWMSPARSTWLTAFRRIAACATSCTRR